jgi:ADP-heptose:LPS heptosyltransferase
MPFLRVASEHARVTLVAKPHAAPLLVRFAPKVEHLQLIAPWTAFRGKYRLHRWPWAELAHTVRKLRAQRCDVGVSARADPRDHILLGLADAKRRIGFPRRGSRAFLTHALERPARPHRAEHWAALASALGWTIPPPAPLPRNGRKMVIHTGAGQPVRMWPRSRFNELATRLKAVGWEVETVDDSFCDLDGLLEKLAAADRFIGNDSGPGHLAALLGVPTFTIFGPQLPELFAPQHPAAAWLEGAPCTYKPCFDSCRFAEPHCIREISLESVWHAVRQWLASSQSGPGSLQ